MIFMKHKRILVIFLALFLSILCIGCGGSESKQSYLADFGAEPTREQEALASCAEGGHIWGETVYTWSNDGSTCTATRTCTVPGCDGEESETTKVDKESQAVFENDAFAPQDQNAASKNADADSSSADDSSDTADQKNGDSNGEDHSTVKDIGAEPAFVVSDVDGNAGDQVSVTISVANNPGIIAAALDVTYDRKKLKLIEATDAKLLAKPTFAQTTEQYPYYVSWNDALSSKNNTKNGTLVTLTFEILKGAKGDTEVSVSYETGNVFDYDLNDVNFKTVSGTIAIK